MMSQVHAASESSLGLSLAGLLMHHPFPCVPLIFLFGGSLLMTAMDCRGKKCLGALIGFDPGF